MSALGLLCVLFFMCVSVDGFFYRTSTLSVPGLVKLVPPRLRNADRIRVTASSVQDVVEQPSARVLKDQIVVQGNTAATLRNLIHFGDEWSRSCSAAAQSGDQCQSLTQSQYERVTGCTSTVEIKTSVAPAAQRSLPEERAIVIEGKADSRVTQGMLAVLCMIFNSLTLGKALEIDPSSLTAFFGFDVMLPTGRQNTFFNMIKLIQSQLQRLSASSSTASETASLTEEGASACAVAMADSVPAVVTVPASLHSHPLSTQGTSAASHSDIHLDQRVGAPASPAPLVPAKDPRSEEVALLLSGGVDSSVALKLLLEQGHRVRAYYLKIWLEDELAHLNSCPWEEDLRYAQAVCDQLGVPLETVSLQKEYWRDVVQYTLAEARSGRTPNPDVMCNSRVKFGTFYDYVGRFHAKIASGHYAQVRPAQSHQHRADGMRTAKTEISAPSPGAGSDDASMSDAADIPAEVELVCSPDPVKDQSYFLCGLTQQQLQRCLFPIGHLHKPDVRALAEKFNLPTMHRKDSQGICFLGKLKFDDFIEHYLGRSPGPVRSVHTGALLGTHQGLWFHTIGQRKGLGPLLHPGKVHAGPWFVCAKDVPRNTLFVSNETHALQPPTQPAQGYLVEQVNWINGVPGALLESVKCQEGNAGAGSGLPLRFKLRHSPHFVSGTLHLVEPDHTTGKNSAQSEPARHTAVRVVLSEEAASVAPGQFVAFYQDDVCVGSGVVADIPITPQVAQLVDAEIARETAVAAVERKVRRRSPRSASTLQRVDGKETPVSGDLVTALVESL